MLHTCNDHECVHVAASPKVQQFSKSKNVIEDDPFQVECIAWGTRPLSVIWTFKGQTVIADGERVILRNNTGSGHLLVNSTLRIQSVQYEDGGDYVCVAENEHGNGTATITIHVKGTVADFSLVLSSCCPLLCYYYTIRQNPWYNKKASCL